MEARTLPLPTNWYAACDAPVEPGKNAGNANDADESVDAEEEVRGHGQGEERKAKEPFGARRGLLHTPNVKVTGRRRWSG